MVAASVRFRLAAAGRGLLRLAANRANRLADEAQRRGRQLLEGFDETTQFGVPGAFIVGAQGGLAPRETEKLIGADPEGKRETHEGVRARQDVTALESSIRLHRELGAFGGFCLREAAGTADVLERCGERLAE